MKPNLPLILFMSCVTAAFGQGLSTDAPIDIQADNWEANTNQKTMTYSGNVIVMQGDIRMHANALTANSADGQTADKIQAQGNVVVDSPAVGTVTGDTGVWDVGARMVTFSGRVVLTKDKNVLRGNVMSINLVNGQARLGMGSAGGRVQGLFTPQASGRNP